MAVEILILSGARQGDRLEISASEFRMGDKNGYEVQFDSLKDPGAKARSILVRLEQDGWHIRNEGSGPLWINQHRVDKSMAIRSSDVVRLSESGPDVSFVIRAGRSGATPVGSSAAAAEIPVLPTVAADRPSRSIPAVRRHSAVPWILVSAGITCLALLVAYVGHLGSVDNTSHGARPVQGDSEGRSGDAPRLIPDEASRLANESQPNEDGAIRVDSELIDRSAPATAPDPWLAIAESNRPAVFPLVIESPGGLVWSFGTCFAIRSDTLVTTASLVTEFERLRVREKGWKMWVCTTELERYLEVQQLQVHTSYPQAVAGKQPAEFFDVALLTVAAQVPHVCELAGRSELEKLDRQARVGCLGIVQPIPKEGESPEPIGRFELLAAEFFNGRLLDIGKLPSAPGASKLLFLPNTFPPTLWGSPVFDERGRVVAIFTLVQRKDGDTNFAVLVAPTLEYVGDWLRTRAPQMWVAPKVPEGSPTNEKAP